MCVCPGSNSSVRFSFGTSQHFYQHWRAPLGSLRPLPSSRPPPSAVDDHVRCTVKALFGSVWHGSMVTDPPKPQVTPCLVVIINRKGEERGKKKKKREVLHLFRCYTHTRPEPGQPSKARGKKERIQKTDQRPNSAGGGNRQTSGTNLHGETDLTKNRAHT